MGQSITTKFIPLPQHIYVLSNHQYSMYHQNWLTIHCQHFCQTRSWSIAQTSWHGSIEDKSLYFIIYRVSSYRVQKFLNSFFVKFINMYTFIKPIKLIVQYTGSEE